MATTVLTSRAVARYVEPGATANCSHCGDPVRFRARVKAQQVICNVYEDGRWDRVEHFHDECYGKAGSPYGQADASQPMRPRTRPAA